MNEAVLTRAKAIVALIGAVVTALLGTVGPDDALFDWLTGIAAVCTAIATYVVPNKLPGYTPAATTTPRPSGDL